MPKNSYFRTAEIEDTGSAEQYRQKNHVFGSCAGLRDRGALLHGDIRTTLIHHYKRLIQSLLLFASLFVNTSYVSAQAGHTATIRGTVRSSVDGTPLADATVQLAGTAISTKTHQNGNFTINTTTSEGTLQVSYIGYQPTEIRFSPSMAYPIAITLSPQANLVDEVQVIGYGQTTRRHSTGSVATISAAEIERQPVTNVLSALSGRMPGVFVQTTNGLPGGNINIQIRGTGSISAGTQPLYIIDGVPCDGSPIGQNTGIANQNIAGAISPLNSLNPSDIESISVLKDADATAIYGSRGANGVVLITTKKGKLGATLVNANISQGTNKVAVFPKLLNLGEYLEVRREAFANDGRTPSDNPTSLDYAPDLTIWSQTESTDWPEYLMGNAGHITQAQVGISGGNAQTNFRISANYRKEGSFLRGDSRYRRSGLHTNLQHTSENQKFNIALSGTYSADDNLLPNPINAAPVLLLLAPNYPLFNPDGSYNWTMPANPLAQLQAKSNAKTNNLVGNLVLSYTLPANLRFRTSVGYNSTDAGQTQIFPAASLYPGTLNYTKFGTNSAQSFIIEPQIDYAKEFANSKLSAMVGATYQHRNSQRQLIEASNFSTESLMENLSSAGSIDTRSNNYTEYKYASVFGRLTYNLLGKYIINGTVRRDGSSRFGASNRFGNFASIGAAWLFAKEEWIKKGLPFLTFGKLRASYGTTGNDQITDFQYLSTYTSGFIYQGPSTLRPSRISNSGFRWESTTKQEASLELGAIRDRILLTTVYYRSHSSNQLVNYTLPHITGFPNYQANLPAVVQNTGWEFELYTRNIEKKDFSWSTTFNLTLPKNRLKSFENLENSSYANRLRINEDITRIYGYRLLGIDPGTGVAQYADSEGEISPTPYFYNTLGKQTPDFYGGIGNSFRLKGFQLDIFGQFSRQQLWGGTRFTPGIFTYNMYAFVLDRWQKAGDVTTVPKPSTNLLDPYYTQSSANLFEAAYFRLKNVSLSYSLPRKVSDRISADLIRIHVQGQNLLTFWNGNPAILDPESGALSSTISNIPPVRTIEFGLQINF